MGGRCNRCFIFSLRMRFLHFESAVFPLLVNYEFYAFPSAFKQFDSCRGRTTGSLGRSTDSHHPLRRHDLKMTISKQLLDRLDAASEVVRYVEAANQRNRTSISGNGGRGGAGGGGRRRNTLASAADDDYPTSTIKHRGNRRRIDPRVAINHIFEGIYKVSASFGLTSS